MRKETIFEIFSKNLSEVMLKFGIKFSVDINKAIYLCPITLNGFDNLNIKSKHLTLEHVPPSSLGGKPLILTSKDSNNIDGHTIDRKMLNFIQSKNFLEGDGAINGLINSEAIGVKGIRATFLLGKEGPKRVVKLDVSHPNWNKLTYKGFDKNYDGLKFNFSTKLTTELPKKSLLKSSYLIAFHKIGYELILNQNGFKEGTYEKILDVLNDRMDVEKLPFVYFDEMDIFPESNVVEILEPKEHGSIAVKVSHFYNEVEYNCTVFLPHPQDINFNAIESIKSSNDFSFLIRNVNAFNSV